jgi:1,4-dihydroxy-2-naphthoate polyprenyltransferase
MKSIPLRDTKIWAFIVLTRPIFLLGGVFLFGLGALIAVKTGAVITPAQYILGQIMVTAIQLTAQYTNEYCDVDCDRLNTSNRTWFTGGSGVLPSGVLPHAFARRAAQISAAVAVIAIALISSWSPLVAVIGSIALIGAWAYSSPPLSLMGTGLGELVATLIVTFLVPLSGFLLFGGAITPLLLLVCLHLVLVHLAMLIAFEIPDWVADHAVNKRTLHVRLGYPRIVYLHSALLLLSYVLLIAMMQYYFLQARFVWLSLPLAGFQSLQVAKTDRSGSGVFRHLTLGAIGLFVFVTLMWVIGFLL